MADPTTKKNPAAHLSEYKWQPGVSPNPNGRPKGSRNKLSESFITALSDDFEKNGVAVIETVRAEKPAEYLKIIAAIVPKEIQVHDLTLEDMSDEELIERLEQVRSLAVALAGAKASERAGSTARKEAPKTAH